MANENMEDLVLLRTVINQYSFVLSIMKPSLKNQNLT